MRQRDSHDLLLPRLRFIFSSIVAPSCLGSNPSQTLLPAFHTLRHLPKEAYGNLTTHCPPIPGQILIPPNDSPPGWRLPGFCY
jgi:hypothetical protein